MKRNDSRHDFYLDRTNGKTAAVIRHAVIKVFLARLIWKQLGIA
jgi:hypothetical protein